MSNLAPFRMRGTVPATSRHGRAREKTFLEFPP
jgi:hypothetical protein